MPSYAILGATGSTGGSILHLLSQSPDNTINCYVRSKSKLLTQKPELADQPNVKIYEGALSDLEVIKACLANTRAAFLCVAPNANMPGCSLAEDAARAVLAACEKLRDEKARVPKLVVLSAAPLNPYLVADMPRFVFKLLTLALCYVYADLQRAEDLIRAQSSWVNAVFVKPGGLVHDLQRGHALSMEKASERFLSFLDLAAGMIEVAEEDGGDEWDGKNVSVLPTSKDVKFEWKTPLLVLEGLLFCFFPWLYRILK